MDAISQSQPHAGRFYGYMIAFVCTVLIMATGVFVYCDLLNDAPANFPIGTDIRIDDGLTVRDVTDTLRESGVVRSSLYLYFVIMTKYGNMPVQAGTYRFSEPQTSREIAHDIVYGENLSPLIRITLPEGFRARDILLYLPPLFENDVTDVFTSHEGYLFPDTYFISRTMSSTDLLELLRTTHNKKLSPYSDAIAASGLTQDEVIILASIIEREAKDDESKRIVSGILQNRLSRNMPLQVDASFDYLLGKTSSELTEDDLAIDSPYNTYSHRGLPPTPISNPGLSSIDAVLNPAQTPFLYYLTADDGTFYYAKTFEEHKRNKQRYLN